MAKSTTPDRPADLVKPSVLAKELGTYLSVIYGMVKRGTIRDYRGPHDQSSMVSRAEVMAAREGGKKARARRVAEGAESGEPVAKKSPLKAGQVVTKARTSYDKGMGQEKRRSFARITEIVADSETGLAVAQDSNGREFYWDADDAKAMLADGRLQVPSIEWLLDAAGHQLVQEGKNVLAESLAEWVEAHFGKGQEPTPAPAPKRTSPKVPAAMAVRAHAEKEAAKTVKKLTAVERQRLARKNRA